MNFPLDAQAFATAADVRVDDRRPLPPCAG